MDVDERLKCGNESVLRQVVRKFPNSLWWLIEGVRAAHGLVLRYFLMC